MIVRGRCRTVPVLRRKRAKNRTTDTSGVLVTKLLSPQCASLEVKTSPSKVLLCTDREKRLQGTEEVIRIRKEYDKQTQNRFSLALCSPSKRETQRKAKSPVNFDGQEGLVGWHVDADEEDENLGIMRRTVTKVTTTTTQSYVKFEPITTSSVVKKTKGRASSVEPTRVVKSAVGKQVEPRMTKKKKKPSSSRTRQSRLAPGLVIRVSKTHVMRERRRKRQKKDGKEIEYGRARNSHQAHQRQLQRGVAASVKKYDANEE